MTDPPVAHYNPVKAHATFINIARLIATILIIIFHAIGYYPFTKNISGVMFLLPPIPFFFFFAGYFSKKTDLISFAKRLSLLISMLLIWECICIIFTKQISYNIYLPLHVITHIKTNLLNYPLWFLRHLLFFTLFLPVLLKFKSYCWPIAIVLLMLSDFKSLSFIENEELTRWFSFTTFSYFILGIAAQSISLAKLDSFFRSKWATIIISYVAFCLIIQVYQPSFSSHYYAQPVLALAGILFLCALGMMILLTAPKIGLLIAELSACCFLMFTCHVPIFLFVEQYLGYNPQKVLSPWGVALLWSTISLITSLSIIFILKRLAPFLLPYIAGIKK